MSKGEKSDRERKKDNKKEGKSIKNNKNIYSSKHVRQTQIKINNCSNNKNC